MKQSFKTVKVGVCDCFWTPRPTDSDPNPDEFYLGLTKGGVKFSYTPKYHEITVDQFGNSATESVLLGEDVSAAIPLAETSIEKLALSCPTATQLIDSSTGKLKKLLYGSRPGVRLEGTAGSLRLHPIAMGSSKEEDIVIFKAVNKSAMELAYKLDEETIYSANFIGTVERASLEEELSGEAVPFLFAIGDPSIPIE